MGLVYAPHTFQIRSRVDNITGDATVEGTVKGDPETVRGLICARDAVEIFRSYGVELSSPYEGYLSLTDRDKVDVGYLIDWDGRTFVVSAKPLIRNANTGAEHVGIALEEVKHEPT